MDLTGIYNDNEFYTEHYLSEKFEGDIKAVLKQWRDEAETESQTPYKRLEALNRPFFELQNSLTKLSGDNRITELKTFYKEQLNVLGYDYTENIIRGADDIYLPVAAKVEQHGRPSCWILESGLIAEKNNEESNLDPLELKIDREQLVGAPPKSDTAEGMKLFDVINKIIFRMEEPPRWVLIMGPVQTVLIDRTKWNEKRLMRFDWSEIFARREKETLQASTVLLHRESLVPSEGESLLESLDEASHKHAYGVSEDLKYSIREAVEKLGNEAIWYLRNVRKEKVYGEIKEREFTNECLRYIYRMLFLFYIESRPELGFAPMDSEVYRKGYSLEHLRDFEMVKLTTPEGRNGYYLHRSISKLFQYVFEGIGDKDVQGSLLDAADEEDESLHHTFKIPPLHGHIFDPERTPNLNKVKLRNHVWQDIIELMSLSRGGGRNRRGRVSYAQLGINQLGAVYEGLLSYTGFFAEEDIYEVKKAGETYDPLKHAYFVTKDELEEYNKDERVFVNGEQLMHEKGSFIYRLSGREREKSASYYTPEVLTESLVKYSLKELVTDEMSADDLLNLTICEPAMGSGAFLNEAMNQLADLYLQSKQEELGEALDPDRYMYEKQRVKAYLADNNVYGVDLNPIAVELAEVSLWLNTIHKDGHVPWFGEQLRTGNSLIGARREVYRTDQLTQNRGRYGEWMFNAPKRVPLGEERDKHEIYHFLLPDNGMANYTDEVFKTRYKEQIKTINNWQNKFVKSFDEEDLPALRRLSNSVDRLWDTHIKQLRRLKAKVDDPLPVYGHEIEENRRKSTQQKDRIWNRELRSKDVRASSPYRRLKLAMDYWCSLWFWPIDKAELLPSRDQYLMDLQMILDGEIYDTVPKVGEQGEMFADTLTKEEQKELFDELGYVNVDELCRKFERLGLVRELTERYRFMHWELEYADLFSDRGGFDLILGNPPWLQINFNEAGILGDFNPIFSIRDFSASKLAELRGKSFKEYRILENEWRKEFEEAEGTQNYLNAISNYSLLEGQKANLYKCFIPRGWNLANYLGIVSYLHPEGIYDDPKAGLIRAEAYKRLSYHFQFQNERKLFPIYNRSKFSINIYNSKNKGKVSFYSISNLFIPKTIDLCFLSDGRGEVMGIKNKDGSDWNEKGHKNRIIHIQDHELKIFVKQFDKEGTPPIEAPLPALHSQELISVSQKLANQAVKLIDLQEDYFSTQHWNETIAEKDGIIKRSTEFPANIENWILSGPHFYVGNPIFQTPKRVCKTHRAYDVVDLSLIPEDYLPRTNYISDCNSDTYLKNTPKVSWIEDGENKPVDNYYRLVNRAMISIGSERSLISGIIPPKASHTNGVRSYAFKKVKDLCLFSGFVFGIPFDYMVKLSGRTNLHQMLDDLPFVENETKHDIIIRVLRLVCLTKHYSDLWREAWNDEFMSYSWLKNDVRLCSGIISELSKEWQYKIALRKPFERRQALIEIDVITSKALGISLEELKAIYRIQFPVRMQYEADTWYDKNGHIIFTVSKGLADVGLKRNRNSAKRVIEDKPVVGYSVDAPNMKVENEPIGWEDVKHLKEGVVYKTFMDDTQPGGPVERTVEYHAPFDRCDREKDYEIAWKAFEERGITSEVGS